MFGAAAGDCSVDVTKPSSLALLDWNAQALKSPQSLYSLTIYAPTFSLQECRYAPVAEARMPLAKFMQPLCESCLETALAFFIPLARSVLPDNAARATFRNCELLLQNTDGSSPRRRA
jgi:hypothetical protein